MPASKTKSTYNYKTTRSWPGTVNVLTYHTGGFNRVNGTPNPPACLAFVFLHDIYRIMTQQTRQKKGSWLKGETVPFEHKVCGLM